MARVILERNHGFEPRPEAWKAAVLPLHQFRKNLSAYTLRSKSGRGGWIRTNDPLVPNQVRYRTALRLEARE
jgi:hypothetical protein